MNTPGSGQGLSGLCHGKGTISGSHMCMYIIYIYILYIYTHDLASLFSPVVS